MGTRLASAVATKAAAMGSAGAGAFASRCPRAAASSSDAMRRRHRSRDASCAACRRRLDVREELFEHVQQRVVVLRAERFRHEAAAGLQEVDRQPERENGQLVLPVRVL